MKLTILFGFCLILFSCNQISEPLEVKSPDGNTEVTITSNNEGLSYNVIYKGKDLILPSKMGFVLYGNDTLFKDFKVVSTKSSNIDSTWEQPWGEERFVRENFNGLIIHLKENSEKQRKLDIEFKVFNDGFGFRYVFPEQGLDTLIVMDELTEFSFADNHKSWSIPAYQNMKFYILKRELMA